MNLAIKSFQKTVYITTNVYKIGKIKNPLLFLLVHVKKEIPVKTAAKTLTNLYSYAIFLVHIKFNCLNFE